MIVIWGQRFYGQMHSLEDGIVIRTKFFHIWYVPLIPVGSFLITQEEGDNVRGIQVSLWWRSVLLTYASTAMCLAMLGFLVSGLTTMGEDSFLGFVQLALVPLFYLMDIRLNFFRSISPIEVQALVAEIRLLTNDKEVAATHSPPEERKTA